MDPNSPPSAQPTASTEAAPAVPATPEVPTNTPTPDAPVEHKKSFLDSIMTMFGMGPKEEVSVTAAPVEAPATTDAPAATPTETPTTLPQQ